MRHTLSPLWALLISVFILLVGHGLQLTIVPMQADNLGWSPVTIGYLGSAYFFGFVVGCITIPRLVSTVGHIRVFAVLTATATISLLSLSLVESPGFWLASRAITGWTLAGLYMVIESWLNERASTENRGLVLSIYTVITLVAIGMGQLMVGFELNATQLIVLGAILLSLGAIPVGLTRSPAPEPIPKITFNLKEVYRASHVAVIGALASGLVTSGFWSLGPVIGKLQGLDPAGIGIFMAITITGGAVLQLPIGRFSDRRDRRQVIAIVALLGALLSQVAILISGFHPYAIYVLMFLFGGLTLPMYSICLAHANDNTRLPLIEVGSVILLVHSVGAMIGPIFVSVILAYTEVALFIVAELILLLLCLWTFWRIKTHKSLGRHYEPFSDVPKTTQGVIEVFETELESHH